MKRKPVQKSLRLEPSAVTDLILQDWQRTPNLVREGRRLLTDPAMKLALVVIRNSSPAEQPLPDFGVTSEDRIVHQGRIEGYHACLKAFRDLDKYVETEGVHIEPDFGAADLVPELDPSIRDVTDKGNEE